MELAWKTVDTLATSSKNEAGMLAVVLPAGWGCKGVSTVGGLVLTGLVLIALTALTALTALVLTGLMTSLIG